MPGKTPTEKLRKVGRGRGARGARDFQCSACAAGTCVPMCRAFGPRAPTCTARAHGAPRLPRRFAAGSAHTGRGDSRAARLGVLRQDYKAPDYWVHEIQLVIKIYEEHAQILSTLHVKRAEGAPADAPLVLDGEELDLKSISLDGKVIPADPKSSRERLSYSWVEEDVLEVKGPLPAEFKLACDVHVKPHLNTQLSGLYKSSGVYCTQCEAEGFRRITLMQDRPDVMARSAPALASTGSRFDSPRHLRTADCPPTHTRRQSS